MKKPAIGRLGLFVLLLYPLLAQAQWKNYAVPPTFGDVLRLRTLQQTAFALTTDGLYRSADGGQNWHSVRPDNCPKKIFDLNPANQRLYFSGYLDSASVALYESADLGTTWQYASTLPVHDNFKNELVFMGDTVFLAGEYHLQQRIGTIWVERTLPDPLLATWNLKATNNALWAVNNKGIYRSADLGISWAPALLFDQPQNLLGYDIEALGNTLLGFRSNPDKIYHTADQGQSWDSTDASIQGLLHSGQYLYGVNSFDTTTRFFRFSGSLIHWDTVYLTPSKNGNLSYMDIQDIGGHFLLNVLHYGIVRQEPGFPTNWWVSNTGLFPSTGLGTTRFYDQHLFCIAGENLAFSADEGDSWNIRLIPYGFNQFFRVKNTDYGFYDFTVSKTPANQRFLFERIADIPTPLLNLGYVGDTLVGTGQYAPFPLYRSLNGGQNWAQTGQSGLGLVWGWQGQLYSHRDSAIVRSADGGTSWQPVYQFPHLADNSVGRFYIVYDTFLLSYLPQDRIYYSADGGLSFDTLVVPQNPQSSVFRLRAHGHTLLLSTDDGLLYVSTDLGKTWLSISPPPGGYPFSDAMNSIAANDHTLFLPDNPKAWRLRFDSLQQVQGLVFLDANSNGVMDPLEQGAAEQLVAAKVSAFYGVSRDNGHYSLVLRQAADTVFVPTAPTHFKVFPAQRPVSSGSTSDLVFALQALAQLTDLEVQMAATSAFRAGFQNAVLIRVFNSGTLPASGQLVFVPDAQTTVLGATPAATAQSGDTLFWDISALQPLRRLQFRVDLQTAVVPPDTEISILSQVLISDDQDSSNNSVVLTEPVLSSYDPNDKVVSRTQVSAGEADQTELVYTIRFQNLGNYPTDFITLRDTLSEQLDPASFRLVLASHSCKWSIENGRVLVFSFNPVVLTPASTDSVNSQGMVRFAIRPKKGLQPGDSIENTGHIYFDFNPAVVTNTVTTLVKTVSTLIRAERLRVLTIQPNPATETARLCFPDDQPGTGFLSIFNQQGQLVHRMPLTEPDTSLTVANLPAGTYWCWGQWNGQRYTGKLLIL